MDSDASCGVEQTEPNPGLADSLAFNGGSTPTVELLPAAAAIDVGTNDGCTATDQRGALRLLYGDGDQIPQCDVGTYERTAEHLCQWFCVLKPETTAAGRDRVAGSGARWRQRIACTVQSDDHLLRWDCCTELNVLSDRAAQSGPGRRTQQQPAARRQSRVVGLVVRFGGPT